MLVGPWVSVMSPGHRPVSGTFAHLRVQASWMKDRLVMQGSPVLLPVCSRAGSLCVSFLCALSSLSIWACCDHMVFYPELPADCFISQPSGAQPEGFGIVSFCPSGIDVSWQGLKPLLALSTQSRNLPTVPVNSHTWSMFMIFFSL